MHYKGLDHETNQMRIKRLITWKLIYQCIGINTSSWLIDGLITLIEVDIIDKVISYIYLSYYNLFLCS